PGRTVHVLSRSDPGASPSPWPMAPVSVPEHTPFSRPTPVAGALPIPGARELTALLDQSSELMAATARDGRITFANSAWLRALGEERGAMIGRPLRDLVVPAYRRGFVEGALRVLRGESVAGAEL